MASARIELLQNMAIFGGLDADVLDLILQLSRSVVVPESEFFFHRGDQGNSVFVLKRGQVVVVRSSNDREHLLSRLGPGDCFGEMALVDFGPRSASVRVEVEAAAIELSPSCLREVAKHDLKQYAMIYMNMARELSRRLRKIDEQMFVAKVERRVIDDEFDFSSG